MTKAYVVTSGDYSDYHIEAVFDDQQMAEEYKQRFQCDDVEKFDLNPTVPQLRQGWDVYKVQMLRDGTVELAERSDCDAFDLIMQRGRYDRDAARWVDFDSFIVGVLARDEKHAIKIADEKRTQMIAENRW